MEMRDEYGRLFAIVPWYRKATLAGGTTLSFLGGMRTCSDFQSILCREGWQNVASDTLIQWLEGRYMDGWTGGNQSHWDLLDLEGVSSGDPVMNRFIETLNARGHIVHRASQQNTWRMDLGASWKDFLASQSKSQSSQLRNFINRFEKSSDYTFLRARDHQDQVDYYIATLIDLHQSRWKAEEHSGCFGQQSMRDFFTNAMRSLISTGTADIALLLLDRQPVAANVWMQQESIAFGYQCGRDPAADHLRVGRIIQALSFRSLIEDGCTELDFLRGDEPYKAQLRCKPTPCQRVRIVAKAKVPMLRYSFWLACKQMKEQLANYRTARLVPRETSEIASAEK